MATCHGRNGAQPPTYARPPAQDVALSRVQKRDEQRKPLSRTQSSSSLRHSGSGSYSSSTPLLGSG
jgi:hypothetical protein